MKLPVFSRRVLAVFLVMAPLFGLFVYVAARSGPLAPVPVTLTRVEVRALSPALFGIGTVEARHRYRIGPTAPGRVARVFVDTGDRVRAGAVVAELDGVDLADRLRAAEASVAQAQAGVAEAEARVAHARIQLARYRRMHAAQSASEEAVSSRELELKVAESGLAAAREALKRARAERAALQALRANLVLRAPSEALVAERLAEPGDVLVAGQAVVDLIDPGTLWVEVRFDQAAAVGLAPGLPARIALRSRDGRPVPGRVLRVEPLADAVTEELRARVAFDTVPEPPPPVGELAEVTVALPPLPPAPVVPNAALRTHEGRPGVWLVEAGRLRFRPVRVGQGDLEGRVRILEGLAGGETVVLHSLGPLRADRRIQVRERLAGESS